MLFGTKITIGISCPQCNTKYPLRGLQENPICYNCNESMPFFDANDKAYSPWLRDILHWTLAISDKTTKHNSTILVRGNYRYTRSYQQELPYCLKCETTFSEDQIKEAGDEISCQNCNEKLPIRQQDPELTKWCTPDLITWVVNDLGKKSVKKQKNSEPLVFGCMSCGGGLEVDGTERTVTCLYCENHNYLPLDVWLKVNPVPGQQPFFVLTEASEEQVLLAKTYCLYSPDFDGFDDNSPFYISTDFRENGTIQKLEREIEEGLRKLDPGKLSKFAKSKNPAVRMILAKMEGVSEELIFELSKDPNDAVRKKLASAKLIPTEAMKNLAQDEEEKVRTTLAKRNDLPDDLVKQLSADNDWEVRKAIANNSKTPRRIIKTLRKDGDSEVANSARKNNNYHPGFLARLFGA